MNQVPGFLRPGAAPAGPLGAFTRGGPSFPWGGQPSFLPIPRGLHCPPGYMQVPGGCAPVNPNISNQPGLQGPLGAFYSVKPPGPQGPSYAVPGATVCPPGYGIAPDGLGGFYCVNLAPTTCPNGYVWNPQLQQCVKYGTTINPFGSPGLGYPSEGTKALAWQPVAWNAVPTTVQQMQRAGGAARAVSGVTVPSGVTGPFVAQNGYAYAYAPSSGQWYRLVTVTRGLSGVRGAGLGATQNISITGPGNISANVSIGDTLVVTLTEGVAGISTSSMSWDATNPVVVNPTNLGTASGATPGGFDPFTLESITGSGTVTFQWIDTYGDTQTTTLTVTASPPPNTNPPNTNPPNTNPPNTNPPNTNPPNTNPPNTNPPNTNPPNTNPTNTASTGTSTGTIVAIAGAAIVAGGLLAYALAHRAPPSAMPPAAAPRRLPAARTSTPRRKQPRNTRRTAARRRR